VAAVLPVLGLAVKAGGLDSYRAVWRVVAGPESSSNEIAWTLWSAAGAAILSVPLAFLLGRHAARSGSLALLALAILPLALPPVFLGAGYLKLLNLPELSIGGRNPFLDQDGPRLGSMLLLVAKYAPFAIVALWAAFLEIDPRLEESAAASGVRPLDRALGVLVPLVRPALALGAVLVFVLSLREIDTIVLLSSDTIMRRIYTMVHFQEDSQVAALCVILICLEGLLFAAYALLFPTATAAGPSRSVTSPEREPAAGVR
jgi:ABC-type Fe3+ transport system permease subunit